MVGIQRCPCKWFEYLKAKREAQPDLKMPPRRDPTFLVGLLVLLYLPYGITTDKNVDQEISYWYNFCSAYNFATLLYGKFSQTFEGNRESGLLHCYLILEKLRSLRKTHTFCLTYNLYKLTYN